MNPVFIDITYYSLFFGGGGGAYNYWVIAIVSPSRIACLSCPTLYSKLLQTKTPDQHIILLEYDRRFEIYGQDFVYYDYRHPLDLPKSLSKGYFDLVVADPPFLSEECLSKISQTVKFLTRHKVILCTGVYNIIIVCMPV